MNLEDYIENIPDFPKNGIIFKDISPLLASKYPQTIEKMAALLEPELVSTIDAFVGIDARGFIFASGLAMYFKKNLVMVRKGGKLPLPHEEIEYSLEYGTAKLSLKNGVGKVIIVDDVLATGGTLKAAADLCTRAGYEVIDFAVLLNLTYLNDFRWNNLRVKSLFE